MTLPLGALATFYSSWCELQGAKTLMQGSIHRFAEGSSQPQMEGYVQDIRIIWLPSPVQYAPSPYMGTVHRSEHRRCKASDIHLYVACPSTINRWKAGAAL